MKKTLAQIPQIPHSNPHIFYGFPIHYMVHEKVPLKNTTYPAKKQARGAITHIMQLSSHSKGKVHTTKDILAEFTDYYASLYSILGRYADLSPSSLQSKFQEYLSRHSLPTIPHDQQTELEQDFSLEELQLTIKDLKNGKSPGPDGFSPRSSPIRSLLSS